MKNTLFYRIFAFVLTIAMVLTVLPVQPRAAEFDKDNFVGLLVKAESNITMVFYKGHTREAEDKIQPDFTETVDGITSYYFAGISGSYCYDAKRSGDYTIYQKLYITSAEAKTCNVHEVKMNKRAGEWDHTYYYGNTDEYLAAVEYDMSEKWHTEVELITPVFTIQGKYAHQMTTQVEMEEFIAQRDDEDDNMYVFSMGKSTTYDLDIPIVFFTKTDLSGCTTLEQIAQALAADGLPNLGYKAQMHGDEHAAGEGALGVIDLLDREEYEYLLEDINIYVIPRMNPDGAYKCKRNMITVIDESFSNRDPNRDMLSLNLMEQRYYLKTVQLFDPIVELDGHERQRGNNIADIEIGASWRYDSNKELLDLQVEMVQDMFAALEAVDLSGGWYSTNVNTTGAADNTRSFAGAQGRIHILMESRGIYLGNEAYGSRTASQIVSVMAALEYTAQNATAIENAVAAERQRVVKAGETYEESEKIALSSSKVEHPEYTHTTEKTNTATGKITIFDQIPNIYTPAVTRPAPTAYVIPADLPKIGEIIELMDLQQIEYTLLPAGTAIELQQYTGTVDNIVLSSEQSFSFSNGAYVFQMNQVNAYVLAMLMEPDASGQDLVQQNRITAEGNAFPIYRYIHDLENGDISYTIAPAAPQGLTATNATEKANDGVISGLDAGKLYEYKAPGSAEYVKVPAGTTALTGLIPGEYKIRFQETATDAASLDAVCTIGCTVTVYLNSTTGSDTNAGTEETAPLATLEGAYNKLISILGPGGENIFGTIVLSGDYTITSATRVDLPAHGFPITIWGKETSVKLTFNPTTVGQSTQVLAFHGDTTLDHLTFHAASKEKYDYIYACGNKLTIGREVITTSARKTTYPHLVGGDHKVAATDTDLTILAGTWGRVYVGSFEAGHTGTAKLTIDGATIRETIRNKYSGTSTGDSIIDLRNTSFEAYYTGYKDDFSGDVTLILRENVSGTIYTGLAKSGNVTGTVRVVMNGADLKDLTLNNTPGDANTAGTVAKGVITYAAGNAIPVTGFDEVYIDTDSVVNMVADLTVDQISGGGVVETNGYKLTGDGVYGMIADIKSVSLRPGVAGVYFTGHFELHEELPAAGYGIALSVEDETPVAQDGTTSLYTIGQNSVLVKDILKAGVKTGNGNVPVYARTYVKLSDGTMVYSKTVAVNLRQVVTAADAQWSSLAAAQQEALQIMYETFSAEMDSWKLPNLQKKL